MIVRWSSLEVHINVIFVFCILILQNSLPAHAFLGMLVSAAKTGLKMAIKFGVKASRRAASLARRTAKNLKMLKKARNAKKAKRAKAKKRKGGRSNGKKKKSSKNQKEESEGRGDGGLTTINIFMQGGNMVPKSVSKRPQMKAKQLQLSVPHWTPEIPPEMLGHYLNNPTHHRLLYTNPQ